MCIMLYKVLLITLAIGSVNLSDVSYYETLEVSKEATAQEIRHAYKKLAVKYHPDKNPDKMKQEQFIKITKAYETLKDPEKRQQYDLYGVFSTYSRSQELYHQGLYHQDQYVETLTPTTYKSYLTEGIHFIKFYSPYCPPCRALAPHLKTLAEKYHGIIKVGAVNCKYHNAFCYNEMRVHTYPTLVLHTEGRGTRGQHVGVRDLPGLERLILTHLRHQLTALPAPPDPLPVLQLDLDRDALTRVAYRLRGVAVVLGAEGAHAGSAVNEGELVRGAARALLGELEEVDVDGLKRIRDGLRSSPGPEWALYLRVRAPADPLLLLDLRRRYPRLRLGEIDCAQREGLCRSLQGGGSDGWGVMKRGGGYQRVPGGHSPGELLGSALRAPNLQTLSRAEWERVVSGESGPWVVAALWERGAWRERYEELLVTAVGLLETGLRVGIMWAEGPEGAEGPQAVVRGRRHRYPGPALLPSLLQYTETLLHDAVVELEEWDAGAPPGGEGGWVVGAVPAGCGAPCEPLLHQLREVGVKLSALGEVSVGVVRCSGGAGPCRGAPTVAVYPAHDTGRHVYGGDTRSVRAPYLMEWALPLLEPRLRVLTEESFPGSRLDGSSPWLVYFHSPRCPLCYEAFADFAIAALVSVPPGPRAPPVRAGRVDCSRERALCRRERVRRYPTLRVYTAGGGLAGELPLGEHTPRDLHSLLSRLLPPARDEL